MTAPPRRRCFRFSLRTLFALMTIVCVWLGVQVKWIRDRHEFLNGRMQRDFLLEGEPAHAPWPICLLGEEGESAILLHSAVGAKRVKQLFPEAEVLIADSQTHEAIEVK